MTEATPTIGDAIKQKVSDKKHLKPDLLGMSVFQVVLANGQSMFVMGHTAVTKDGVLYIRDTEDFNVAILAPGQWISMFEMDWDSMEVRCLIDVVSPPAPQQAEPHTHDEVPADE